MRIILVLLTLLLVILLSTACEDDTTCGPAFTFSGYVTDSLTGIAIESVTVTGEGIINAPIVTDSTGHYRGSTQWGRVTLQVIKQGYQTQSREIQATEHPSAVNFKLIH